LADVERDLIRTRTAEGRSRAQKRGQHMGRPPKLTAVQTAEARRRRTEGATLAELAQLRRGKEHDFALDCLHEAPPVTLHPNPPPKRDWLSQAAVMIQIIAIIVALASAAFWFQSARITTPTDFHIFVGRSDFPPIGSTGLTARSPALAELGANLAKQSNLNAYAAFLAGISVLLEVFATLLKCWRARRLVTQPPSGDLS
jgi:hypothetical protein